MLLGVDVGGTFTDAVLVDAGALHTAKVPSTPADQALGVLAALREVLARAGAEPSQVERFAHGMTVATNALLEGRTARTALIATRGFTDVIELGRQNRAHLYRPCAAHPRPLVATELRFGAPERTGPDGVLEPLRDDGARDLIGAVADARPEAVAVALLHSYADPAHERRLGELLDELLPEAHVSLSSELVGTFREYERTATTALDAALSPLLSGYLASLAGQARSLGLREPDIMQSSGGLTDVERAGAHAALTVLSGPAGGVGGALLLAGLAGEPRVLCFDMGGTSCDVCVIDEHRVAETAERTVAGRPLALPALDIHTVGAGGGSIAWADAGGALRVGPQSGGAEPGPACYGRGGEEPTVTDANVVLGRIPEGASLAGGVELDREAAERAVAALGERLGLATVACAEGIVRVAESEMLGALRVMTVQRGVDPRGFALLAFGGAGPLHAIALAEALSIDTVLCPRASGVLSALGLAAAAARRDVARTVMLKGLALSRERLAQERAALLDQAAEALAAEPQRARVRYELRYSGQAFELPVEEELEPAITPAAAGGGGHDQRGRGRGSAKAGEPAASLGPQELREAFAEEHERRYGYRDEDAEVELVNLRVSVWSRAPQLVPRAPGGRPDADRRDGGGEPAAPGAARVVFAGNRIAASVIRGEPAPGSELRGPALVAMPEATLLVPPGWQGTVDAHGTIRLGRERA